MTNDLVLNEQLSRQIISERVARAAEPRIHTGTRRHRLATSLHRLADRLEA